MIRSLTINWEVVEGSGSGVIKDTTTEFSWRVRGKPRKPSVTMAGFQTEIYTQALPTMEQERQPLGSGCQTH
jgi:hypothetical protein